MTRSLAFALATAVALLLTMRPAPGAAPPQVDIGPKTTLRVDLDQVLLDRWLSMAPQLYKTIKTVEGSPEAADSFLPQWRRICAKAGFETFERCQDVTAYIGLIISACDRRSRSFRDPIALMRRELAQLETNTSMPAADKEQKLKQYREALAVLPERIPPEHLSLMTANRDRIFKIIVAAWK